VASVQADPAVLEPALPQNLDAPQLTEILAEQIQIPPAVNYSEPQSSQPQFANLQQSAPTVNSSTVQSVPNLPVTTVFYPAQPQPIETSDSQTQTSSEPQNQ